MSRVMQILATRLLCPSIQRSASRSFYATSCMSDRFLHSSSFKKSSSISRVLPGLRNHNLNLMRISCLSYKSDKATVKYFNEEIEMESEALSNLPTIKNFDCKIQGTRVEFHREVNNESVTVTMDINDNVESSTDYDDEDGDDNEAMNDIAFLPVFSIEIKKQSGDTMHFHCSIDATNTPDFPFTLNEMYVVPNGGDEKTAYSTRVENQDEQFHEVIYDSLKARGIDNDFATNFQEFNHVFEHSEYYKFLQTARDFFNADS